MIANFVFLVRQAVSGPGARLSWLIYATVLGLNFFGIWVSLQLIDWSKNFYDALEQLNGTAALHQVGVFAVLTGLSATAFLLSDWLRKTLLLRWRERLTDRVLDVWMGKKTYWHLRPGLSQVQIDNPDQRIAEDSRRFSSLIISESIDLISNTAAIFSYLVVLWSLSDFALQFSILEINVYIPHYMVWAAFLYVLLSSFLTHALGKPIKSLIFQQEKKEANFRRALVDVHVNAVEIAQTDGELAERRHLAGLFGGIKNNWSRLIRQEVVLGTFTRPYLQTILRIPMFLALPAYFAGSVTLGGLMQLASAFSRVATTLSWFIFSYRSLAELVAVSERLIQMLHAENPPPLPDAPQALKYHQHGEDALSLRSLQLATPLGRLLAPISDVDIKAGMRVWIDGDSGQGKTTLLASIAGLWRYGIGSIGLPNQPIMILPQGAHVPAGNLISAACYPEDPANVNPETLHQVFTQIGLEHRLHECGGPHGVAVQGLSMGERQRLGFARVLLHRPRWLILDESTSALDVNAERELLALINEALPDSAILCIAHRPPIGLAPFKKLVIGTASLQAQRISV
ncbi:MAG: ABC transporter ATP-binding protein/permease [Halomonas sp.]|uniref:ABC transporter ATP-binding protein/permease n=1 Tax=Halomonas sp. TaxID=1486246 RepID=UPI003F93F3DC